MSWVAIGVTVASIGVSVGMQASGAGQPKQPDLASSSAELSNANARLLPYRRMLEAAAQQGTKVTLPGQFDYQMKDKNGNWITISADQYQGLKNQFGVAGALNKGVQTRMVPKTIDFSGMGQADIQATIAKEMAKAQLQLNDKYGIQFIDQALQQEKLADPQGYAARQAESDLIQKQIADQPDRPVAQLLDKQIGSELTAAEQGKLDPEMHGVLDQAVGKALAARGQAGLASTANGQPVDFEQPLTTGFAGEQRQAQAAQKGLSWLSSGATPEDTEYRREMQNLANLSALVNGTTPESQFASLSGAQNGPVKMNPGQPLATMPNNGFAAQSVANSNWMTGISQALNQVNPGTMAMQVLGGAGQIAGSMGYKPFAQN